MFFLQFLLYIKQDKTVINMDPELESNVISGSDKIQYKASHEKVNIK